MRLRPVEMLFISATISLALHSSALAQKSDARLGAERFMEYCASCHGADGRGGDKAPSIVDQTNTGNRSDAELFHIVHDGTKRGMPPFAQIGDSNIEALVQFVRQLAGKTSPGQARDEPPVTGDVNAGRTLYFGKGQCSDCHLMRGKGGFIARNLTNYGRGRSAEAILQAVTNPDDPLVPSSQVVTVKTAAGVTMTGVLRNEDAFSLALQTRDGRFHLLERSDVKDVRYTGRSLMPRDYNSKLSSKELNDIVSFLIGESRSSYSADGAVQ